MSEAIERLVAEAVKTLGWSDEDNTKKTPVHIWYEQKFGVPDPNKFAWDWCDAWITYIAHKAGLQRPMRCSSGMTYTVAHVQAFKANREWHAGSEGVQRGDIVFFDWHDGNGIEHVGLALGPAVDGKVPTIEGNTLNMVAERQRDVANVAGYGRPVYAPPVLKPGPFIVTNTSGKPEPVIKGVAVSTTVIFEDIGPHGTAAANKAVQTALNRFKPTVAVDGIYGPQTQAAYAAWQRHLGFSGADADGLPGWTSATRLAAAYAFHLLHRADAPKPPAPAPAPEPTAWPPPVSSYEELPEPAHNYARLTFGGKTVNMRTRAMLRLAEAWAGVSIHLTQGSYNRGVAASAGTHDGGGCVDINVDAWGSAKRAQVVQALRKAGFAAWLRTPNDGFAYHIHACAIGDREMAGIAREQVQAYFNGRNGLANNRADSVERHWPDWADKYNQ